MTIKDVPNILTGLRIVLTLGIFGCLLAAAASPSERTSLLWVAFAAWIIASVTDYFDGWLARRWKAFSAWGAMLDPIADKIAVAGAVLGLVALDPGGGVALPGGIILVREFFVSGLREVGGARGVRFPVTRLAKWKTTAQLVALALELLAAALGDRGALKLIADVLLWAAAVVTVWTGWEYAMAARRDLGAGSV
jgi:CDP-diacylglycerol--glycerol-3-phosphate 3-phosphatidyltransferase